MRRADPLIVGAGPAGCAAAIALRMQGIRPLVLERTAAPADTLCGGFLSWRTLATLERLGVHADDLNRARIDRLRVFAGKHHAQAPLPNPALAVSRRRLDSLLAARAATLGAGLERGTAVRSIEQGLVRLSDSGTVAGGAILLASGKQDVRGVARPGPEKDPALGLRVRLIPGRGLHDRLAGAIELHLFDRGYAGLVLQEDGSANLCMTVRRSRLHEAGTPKGLLARLAEENPRLGDALSHRSGGEPVDAVANIPYGWRARATAPGLFRLGDQAGVIPSLAGEGIGIALASGIAAADSLARHGVLAAPAFQRRLARRLARPVCAAMLIRDMADLPLGRVLLCHGATALPPLVRLAARLTRLDEKAD